MSARYTKYNIRYTSAFTLVELLIVISILGILAAIGLVAFSSAQIRGRDAQRKSDLTQITRGVELFYADYGKYPPTDASDTSGQIYSCPFDSVKLTGTACSWGSSEFRDVDSLGNTKTTYIKILPKDPISGYSYRYRVDPSGQKYQVYAHLENTQDPSLITTSYNCGGTAICNFGLSSPNTTSTDTSW